MPSFKARRVLRSCLSSLLEAFFARRGPRILYYHRVDFDPHRSCVHPREFCRQMHYLKTQGFTVLDLGELCRRVRSLEPLPPRSVVLTFDDGFADNFIHAYPVLRELGFTATVFLTVGFIGGQSLPVLSEKRLGLRPLSWEQVAEMVRGGISFGSHTFTHRPLPALDGKELRREVWGSRLFLQERIGREVGFFCYPRGQFTPRVREVVKEAGYRGACSVFPGAVGPESDLFALPRTYIGRDDHLGDFRKKLAGAYDLLHAAVQLRRRLLKLCVA